MTAARSAPAGSESAEPEPERRRRRSRARFSCRRRRGRRRPYRPTPPPPEPGPMPAELRQVGGNLVPGVGASSRGPGGGGRGAGLPGRTRFCSAERPAGGGYCLSFGPARSAPGQAGRRGGVSAPPGGGGCARRGAGPRGLWGPGAGAPGGATPRLEARPGSGWVHPRVAPRTGAWAGVVGEGLPEQRLCAGGMPSPERSAGRGLQLLGGARWASPPPSHS